MSKQDTKHDLENSLSALETLVNKMETGELSLEASLAEFEKGVKLIKTCQKALSDAEQKIKQLSDQNDEE